MPPRIVLLTPSPSPAPAKSPQAEGEPKDRPDRGRPPNTGAAKDWTLQFVVDPKRYGNTGRGSAYVELTIPRESAALNTQLTQALESAYIAYGWPGVDRFAVAVFGLDEYGALFLRSRQFRQPLLKGEALLSSLRGAVPQDRQKLWAAFEVAFKALRARSASVRARLQKAALARLLHVNLPQARADTLRETRRYLSLRSNSDAGAKEVLEAGDAMAAAELPYGPDGPALLEALQSLLPNAKAMREAQLKASVLSLGRVSPLWPLALAVFSPYREALLDANKQRDQAGTAFREQFANQVTVYPILPRLLDRIFTADAANAAIEITRVVQEAWKAANTAAAEFKANPELVWTLPALIEQTIQYGFQPKRDAKAGLTDREAVDSKSADRFDDESALAQRVAADEMGRPEALTILGCINAFLSVVDVSTTLIQPEFPLFEVALFLVSLLAGAAELTQDYIKSEPQRMTSRAALDESDSVSTAVPYVSQMIKTILWSVILLPSGTAQSSVRAGAK